MNSQQIQCLLEVGKESSFTKAAKNLYLTQSTVSRYIASLEKELGHTLFVRVGSRKVELTEAGNIYFKLFSDFSKEFQYAEEQIESIRKHMRIGYNIGWNISSLLMEAVKECRRAWPDACFSFECWELRPLLQALMTDRLDAAVILGDYPIWNDNLEGEPITTVQRGIVYSETLLGREANCPGDFDGRDFFVLADKRIQQITQNIEQLCQSYSFTPNIIEVANFGTLMARVESGLGAALMDEWSLRPGWRFIGLDCHHTVCLAWKAGTDPAAVLLLKDALLKVLDHGDS